MAAAGLMDDIIRALKNAGSDDGVKAVLNAWENFWANVDEDAMRTPAGRDLYDREFEELKENWRQAVQDGNLSLQEIASIIKDIDLLPSQIIKDIGTEAVRTAIGVTDKAPTNGTEEVECDDACLIECCIVM
jgi:hypothetical protein